MHCPTCGNGLIQKKTKRGNLHQCELCLGMWFDKANFRRYSVWLACELELKKEADLNLKPRKVVNIEQIREKTHTCPQCNVGLAKVNYAYDSNIIIDKCKNCEGIWLDAFEISQIARHIKRDPRVEEICKGLITNEPLEEIEKFEKIVETLVYAIGTFI